MTEWLVDKSALARLPHAAHPEEWLSRISRGLVRVSTPTLLEFGFSARNSADWDDILHGFPIVDLIHTPLTVAAENRAVELQRMLADRGQHRATSIPDLLIAALAETHGLTVLHVDKDFELISELTGQPVEHLSLAPDAP